MSAVSRETPPQLGRRALTKTAKASKSAAPAQPAKQRDVLTVETRDANDFDAAVARKLTRPEVGAAATIERWQPNTHDVNELVRALESQVAAVNGGDMQRAESMLIAQAHTLNEVFNNLMRRAVNQEYLKQWETYMRVGMKAQNQCRMTLETLAEMKDPRPVAFVKQANISHGPQQVNNGVLRSGASTQAGAGAQETQSEPNRLLEQQHGEWMDTGAQSAASGADSHLVPVEKFDGAEKRSR